MKKIFLQKNKSKSSVNEEVALGINLTNPKRILPQDNFFSTINLVDVYNDERYECNKIRLNCVIRPFCSNVLFNPFTEIIQNEGSSNAVSMHFSNVSSLTNISPIYKTEKDFDGTKVDDRLYNLIEDTQLSSKKYGNLTYHCGLDFLNNHVLRSTTFKKVNPISDNKTSEDFNTMKDYHRNYNGVVVSGDTVKVGSRDFSNNNYKMHIYTFDDILTFNDCFKQKLKEENGWFGFINKPHLKTFDKLNSNELFDINKPINNGEPCEFIDMYPDRSLFYFTPKYNNFRHRLEKNWNYVLTYPYSSTTEVPFIASNGNLRLFLVNETYTSDFKCFSMSKHGLKEGDYINLYKNDNILFNGLSVTKIEDEYTFYVSKNGFSIDSKYEVSSNNKQISDNKNITTYKFIKDDIYYYDTQSNFKTFSFRKVINSKEVDYYVKLLTKLPNWKFPTEKITEKLIYDTWGGVESKDFKKYQDFKSSDGSVTKEQFENHISKLSFSKNIYNDDISEIIFTDDIDINYLHDNLNRPLTSIYLTIIKNNNGYKEWYQNQNTTDETIEFSHCFGPVTCGFYLSPYFYDTNEDGKDKVFVASNSRTLHHGKNNAYSGLTTIKQSDEVTDEVKIDDYIFYGDLYSYSHETCEEELIQKVDGRFNTYQREFNGVDNYIQKLHYCDIKADDYDLNGAWNDSGKTTVIDFLRCNFLNMKALSEGYYYQQNYEIPIRTISDLQIQTPKFFTIRKIEENDDNYQIFTNETNFLELNDKILLYEKNHDDIAERVFSYKVIKVLSHREFICKCEDKNDISQDFKPIKNKSFIKVIKIDKTVPNHAEILLDGSCRLVWRDILQNGFDKDNGASIERYPFTNGRLHVMKDFNFFLKRQNPHNNNILTNHMYTDFNIDGNFIDNNETNNYYTEKDIRC